jgi:endonuclease/exonuclease/phosphatase family metal-dependent hydrolase
MKRLLKVCGLSLLALVVLVVVGLGGLVLLNLRTPSETDLAKSVLLGNPPASLKQPLTVKVVTFNIWDLHPSGTHRDMRMPAIGEALAELAPDVVGFQEAFYEKDRQVILDELTKVGLSHSRYFPSGLVGSGLFVVSRWPIREAFFLRYTEGGKPHAVWHGDWWAGKGVALVRLELPGGAGYIDVFNTHAHAGYGEPDYDSVRLSNMRECAAFVTRAALKTVPAFAVGDFNCKEPESQYPALVEGADLQRLMNIESRIDHIFAPRNPAYAYEVLDTEPIAGTLSANGEEFELSDHTGYISTIRITPSQVAE